MTKQAELTATTRKKLMDAFWELYCNNDIRHISVGAVARNAGYNRSTFYEYFLDVYDLLEQLENDLLIDLGRSFDETSKNGVPWDIASIKTLSNHFLKNFDRKLYVLLGDHGDPAFVSKMIDRYSPMFLKNFGISENNPHVQYLITYCISSLTGLLKFWFENGKSIDEDQFITLSQSLITNGITGFITIHR